MTAPLEVTYAGELYDRTLALYTGQVQIPGVALRYLMLPIEEVFWRQARYREFDLAEYSLGSYLATFETSQELIGLPIFPSRAFRHSGIYVRTDRSIKQPRDLEGRTVGTPEWTQTASLWVRGILAEQYSVDITSIRWRIGGLHESGRQEKASLTTPAGYDIRPVEPDQTLDSMLVDGQLDALVSARPPHSFASGNPVVRRLFEDYRAVETRYFQETRIFPIMHLVTIRQSTLERAPWLPGSILRAFERSREIGLQRLRDSTTMANSLAWANAYAADEQRLLGDAFAYGLAPARTALDRVLRYAHEQGLTSRRLQTAELFVTSTLSVERI